MRPQASGVGGSLFFLQLGREKKACQDRAGADAAAAFTKERNLPLIIACAFILHSFHTNSVFLPMFLFILASISLLSVPVFSGVAPTKPITEKRGAIVDVIPKAQFLTQIQSAFGLVVPSWNNMDDVLS